MRTLIAIFHHRMVPPVISKILYFLAGVGPVLYVISIKIMTINSIKLMLIVKCPFLTLQTYSESHYLCILLLFFHLYWNIYCFILLLITYPFRTHQNRKFMLCNGACEYYVLVQNKYLFQNQRKARF